ncbi:hypothetical protein RHSIM_Rhsim12G0096000 [Rhododendron simsii]|uniref:Uncharacterized protein n=1 Tax=Rhododendron simsii TaxID=118357 RepID=A0A834L9J1_RHOSS|nr:hypothetical protein RHSIM_Rhsim12G0096000 [Rhododendron simsii]
MEMVSMENSAAIHQIIATAPPSSHPLPRSIALCHHHHHLLLLLHCRHGRPPVPQVPPLHNRKRSHTAAVYAAGAAAAMDGVVATALQSILHRVHQAAERSDRSFDWINHCRRLPMSSSSPATTASSSSPTTTAARFTSYQKWPSIWSIALLDGRKKGRDSSQIDGFDGEEDENDEDG